MSKDTKLDTYQKEALDRALKMGRYGLFFQQRVGKSRVAVYFIGHLMRNRSIDKALIVCPLISRDVWVGEIQKILTSKVEIRVVNTSKDLQDIPPLTVCIINYDKLKSYKEILYKIKFPLVIADEVHAIKNRASKRSKIVGHLGELAKYTLGLTGTPYSNETNSKDMPSFKDLFGIYRFIDPRVFGTRWSVFESDYCIKGGYMGYSIVSYRCTATLLKIVDDTSMRVLRKDVMKEPEVQDIVLKVYPNKKFQDLYAKFKKDAFLELSSTKTLTASMVAVQRMRLQQIAGGFVKIDDSNEYKKINTTKLDTTLKYINELSELGRRVVVSFKYLAELHAMRGMLKAGDSLSIHGGVSEKDRVRYIESFKGSGVNILLVQEQTVSVSLDLSFCDCVVFYSVGDDLVTHSQIRDRFMGRNQKSDLVNYYYMIADKTIDLKIYNALKNNISKSELYSNWNKWI